MKEKTKVDKLYEIYFSKLRNTKKYQERFEKSTCLKFYFFY